MTLIELMQNWCAVRARQTCAKTQHKRAQYLTAHLYPRIAGMSIDQKPCTLFNICAQIQEQVSAHVARRVLQDIASAYDYGCVMDLIDRNPAARLSKFLKPPKLSGFSFLPPREFGAMLREVDRITRPSATLDAFYALVFTALRRNEVVGARWEEIDFVSRTWTIPAGRMKMQREHTIPISAPLYDLLYRRKALGKEYIFDGRSNGHVAPSNVIRTIYNTNYAKRQTLHGIRKVFSTRANDCGLWSVKAIERQLDHRPRGVAGVYDKSELLAERRRLMDWWADQVQTWRGIA